MKKRHCSNLIKPFNKMKCNKYEHSHCNLKGQFMAKSNIDILPEVLFIHLDCFGDTYVVI